MDALKSKKRFIQENAFKQKREKPRLKFNPGLTLIGLRTTGQLGPGQLMNYYVAKKRTFTCGTNMGNPKWTKWPNLACLGSQ